MPAWLVLVDSDEPLKPSKRNGLEVPPEPVDAAEESLTTGKTKEIPIRSQEQADSALRLLRSLTNQKRYGYKISKEVIANDSGKTVKIKFFTTGKKE